MNFPLHPVLVHFPIAFLYGALILHAIQLWRPNWMCRVIGIWLLGLSAALSIFSALTGEKEAARAGQVGYSTEILEIMNRHELMGNIVTWGSITLFLVWIYLFFKNLEARRIDILAMACVSVLFVLVCFF